MTFEDSNKLPSFAESLLPCLRLRHNGDQADDSGLFEHTASFRNETECSADTGQHDWISQLSVAESDDPNFWDIFESQRHENEKQNIGGEFVLDECLQSTNHLESFPTERNQDFKLHQDIFSLLCDSTVQQRQPWQEECQKKPIDPIKEFDPELANKISQELGLSNRHLNGDGAGKKNAWGRLSYADLIGRAIESSPEKRLTLAQIYEWMVRYVPYFKDKGDKKSSVGWKNSVRHNLSLHEQFVRIRENDSSKTSWWTLNTEANRSVDGCFSGMVNERKRRKKTNEVLKQKAKRPSTKLATKNGPQKLKKYKTKDQCDISQQFNTNIQPSVEQQNGLFLLETVADRSHEKLLPVTPESQLTEEQAAVLNRILQTDQRPMAENANLLLNAACSLMATQLNDDQSEQQNKPAGLFLLQLANGNLCCVLPSGALNGTETMQQSNNSTEETHRYDRWNLSDQKQSLNNQDDDLLLFDLNHSRLIEPVDFNEMLPFS